MGLDIYKFEVVDDSDESITLYPDDTNKSKTALFEKFNKFVKVSKVDGIDRIATFENLGKDYQHYDFVGTGEGIDFYNSHTEERLTISFDQAVHQTIIVKELPVKEIKYQRKQMYSEFYTKFLAGCWYISEDTEIHEDDSKDYIFCKEDLDKAKKFAVDGAPIKEWDVADNQFVHFNY